MNIYQPKVKKQKRKTIPNLPKHMDNPNSKYERKTDWKIGKQTMWYITREDFEKMQRACLVKMQKSKEGSLNQYRWYRNYVLMMCGVNLGIRTTTLLELTPRNVNGGRVNIREHKTGKIFQMTLRDNLQKLIESYIDTYGFVRDEYMFKSSPSSDNKPLTRQSAYNFVTQLAREVGVKYNVGAYSLRKSFARWLYDDTGDIYKVMRVLGHSSPVITARYICLEEEAVELLRGQIEYGFDKFI